MWWSQYSGLRLRSRADSGATHILEQPRIMQVNAVCQIELRTASIYVIWSHAVLTALQTVQHPWRGPRPRRVLMDIKGPSRDKSGILSEAAATGSPVGEPSTDPCTSFSIIWRGVRGAGRREIRWPPPPPPPTTMKHPAASTGPCRTAVRKHHLSITTARSGTGSAQTRSQEATPGTTGTDPEPHSHPPAEGESPPTQGLATDSTGMGGTGYDAGVTDSSTTGSIISVTIDSKTPTSKKAHASSRSTPRGAGSTSGLASSMDRGRTCR